MPNSLARLAKFIGKKFGQIHWKKSLAKFGGKRVWPNSLESLAKFIGKKFGQIQWKKSLAKFIGKFGQIHWKVWPNSLASLAKFSGKRVWRNSVEKEFGQIHRKKSLAKFIGKKFGGKFGQIRVPTHKVCSVSSNPSPKARKFNSIRGARSRGAWPAPLQCLLKKGGI